MFFREIFLFKNKKKPRLTDAVLSSLQSFVVAVNISGKGNKMNTESQEVQEQEEGNFWNDFGSP